MLTLTPAEVPAKVAEGWTLLDVRTPEEWDQARIAGAVHLPMDRVVAQLPEIGDRVICVCAVGGRSAAVADYLAASGRTVANLDGGLRAWVAAGLPLVR